VLVRDPTGKRRDAAFFCTDPAAEAPFILEAYARRWCWEITQPHYPQDATLDNARAITDHRHHGAAELARTG
jgi:hypothetical protein